MAAGLRPYRLHQVLFVADEAARFAADGLQVPHSEVQAVLGGRPEVVTRLGRDGKLTHPRAEKKLGSYYLPITTRPVTRMALQYREPSGFKE